MDSTCVVCMRPVVRGGTLQSVLPLAEKRLWEVSIFDCHLERSICTCLLLKHSLFPGSPHAGGARRHGDKNLHSRRLKIIHPIPTFLLRLF